MSNYSMKEKRQILAEFFETLARYGYDLTPYVGKPLKYFNYASLKANIREIMREHGDTPDEYGEEE